MSHGAELAVEFLMGLFEIDREIASVTKAAGCPHCGGQLHRADYPRKPRGLESKAEPWFARRLSFCCAERGCRKRRTPPSVRFLGRRVYAAIVVVLAAASKVIPPGREARRRQRRWRRWFRGPFAASAAFVMNRGAFGGDVPIAELPASLLVRLRGNTEAERGRSLLTRIARV